MEWTTSLQNALNYIEENLCNNLKYEEIAKRANCSVFHFQRIFAFLCGYSIGEYIRNRRLSLSGSELSSSKIKVIDVAFKYGYESPESFCRAFVRFHGITPSQARIKGSSLKAFSSLSVKLTLDGGCIMDYRIEKKGPFKLVSKKELFSIDMEESKKAIPKFWNKCRQEGVITKLCKYIDVNSPFKNSIVGTCFENKAEKENFPYSIGAVYNGLALSDDFIIDDIGENTWAVFPCTGAMPFALQNLMKRIYSEFFPASEYKPSGEYEIEVYPDGDIMSQNYKCEIWISIVKK